MMKLVFSVLDDIKKNPKGVKKVQEVTLNKKSVRGLNGTYGLYGSEEWIHNLKTGVIPQRTVSGIIQSTRRAGMYGSLNRPNSAEIITDEGKVDYVGIREDMKEKNARLFTEGKRVEVKYYIEELKTMDWGVNERRTMEDIYEIYIEV
ncbi:hypothetical protein P4S72_28690 [Vibrio sp. PP-XX7]